MTLYETRCHWAQFASRCRYYCAAKESDLTKHQVADSHGGAKTTQLNELRLPGGSVFDTPGTRSVASFLGCAKSDIPNLILGRYNESALDNLVWPCETDVNAPKTAALDFNPEKGFHVVFYIVKYSIVLQNEGSNETQAKSDLQHVKEGLQALKASLAPDGIDVIVGISHLQACDSSLTTSACKANFVQALELDYGNVIVLEGLQQETNYTHQDMSELGLATPLKNLWDLNQVQLTPRTIKTVFDVLGQAATRFYEKQYRKSLSRTKQAQNISDSN